jgi:hypothetical protein
MVDQIGVLRTSSGHLDRDSVLYLIYGRVVQKLVDRPIQRFTE